MDVDDRGRHRVQRAVLRPAREGRNAMRNILNLNFKINVNMSIWAEFKKSIASSS